MRRKRSVTSSTPQAASRFLLVALASMPLLTACVAGTPGNEQADTPSSTHPPSTSGFITQIATYSGDAPTSSAAADLSGTVRFTDDCLTIIRTRSGRENDAFVPVFPKNALAENADGATFTTAAGTVVELREGSTVLLSGGYSTDKKGLEIPPHCPEVLFGIVHSAPE